MVQAAYKSPERYITRHSERSFWNSGCEACQNISCEGPLPHVFSTRGPFEGGIASRWAELLESVTCLV